MPKLVVAPAPFRVPSSGRLSPLERLLQGSRTSSRAASPFQTGHTIEALVAYVATQRTVAGHIGESGYEMTGEN